jgi:catechol 2,3-dioxygenase-like lactoylglutathione lyase family enzyme
LSLHHIDIHVDDLEGSRRLLAAFMPLVGYELRLEDEGYISYWTGVRPSIGFIADGKRGSGMMQLAFAVASSDDVDAVAHAALAAGAQNIDGPGPFPEYDPDYYAVFFEDSSGNKFEVCRA